tara:strand:+ start:315 stop:494 length:180 start_codon:yes stop_codon:yes gene_type:complete
MNLDVKAHCQECARAIRWGQKNPSGAPLEEKCRIKLCYDCAAARRDRLRAKVVPLRVTA